MSDPTPIREETREDWKRLGLRYRLLHGQWGEDALDRLRQFFDSSTYNFLPEPVLAFNAFKSFVHETATLFDGDVTVRISGRSTKASVDMLALDLLWPQMQEVLELVRGMNDALVYREWDNEQQQVRYEPVATSEVEVWPNPKDRSQPARVDHYHDREVRGSEDVDCRDVWDLRDPANPLFAIEAWIESDDGAGRMVGGWVDVTEEVMPEVAGLPGRWPFWEHPPEPGSTIEDPATLGAPIWPWTMFHTRISNRLVDSCTGHELVDLALVASVLWTNWTGGMRDVAHEQRWMLDCDIAGMSSETKKQTHTSSNPMMVMKLVSTDTVRSGAAGQWNAPMDPKAYAEAIAGFMASGALFAGLSSADVSVTNTGLSRVSGFAIEVSREGKRKVERRMVAPMNLGVVHNLVGAARLANAYGAARLPTDRRAYTVSYTYTAQSSDETRSEVEETTALVDAGFLHPADALRRFDTSLDDKAAQQRAIEIAQFKAQLAAVKPDQQPTDQQPM